MSAVDPLFAAIDIGGTKIAGGLVDGVGNILWQARSPMSADADAAAGFNCVTAALDAVVANRGEHEISAVGICCPGPLDPATGVIINPPNLPCWRDFPLAERLRDKYQVPISIENDANAAALAEALWGAGQGYSTVFYATLGTGIGTGLVMNGKIYNGRTGAAPEGGHLPIDIHGPLCGCGKRGCIEALASGPAIARRARQKLAEGRQSSLSTLKEVTTEAVATAWRGGDPLATEVLRESAELLAIWLGSIIDLLEPDVIVVGGGIGELFSHWLPEILELLPRWSINSRCCEIPITLAKYSSDAGIAGAAALCAAQT